MLLEQATEAVENRAIASNRTKTDACAVRAACIAASFIFLLRVDAFRARRSTTRVISIPVRFNAYGHWTRRQAPTIDRIRVTRVKGRNVFYKELGDA